MRERWLWERMMVVERVALFVLCIVSTSTACRLPHTHTHIVVLCVGGVPEGAVRGLCGNLLATTCQLIRQKRKSYKLFYEAHIVADINMSIT